ncbi:non-ribosomal peptide synthetase, partial [Aquimarina celericrescens]|nr:non-ribosomal peptide synthetase [Aquimarina celericrescens]
IKVFESAFNVILERHEALRTIFVENNGNPKQKILSYEATDVSYFETNNVAEIQNAIFTHEFDLDISPLFKIAVVKNDDSFTLFFNVHHIISDGRSMDVISKELMEIYQAKLLKLEPNLPVLETHYKDYTN